MSDHMNVLLVGAGYMGEEYCKVLKSKEIGFTVVCRSEATADRFELANGIRPIPGGVDAALAQLQEVPEHAIVAVNVDQLAQTTIRLLDGGVKKILVEKPAGMDKAEIRAVRDAAERNGAAVYVAYNRRFFASVEKAQEIIAQDGGVDSFHFEFTEWGFKIAETDHPAVVKEAWMFANSTHVIDLAFFLGGFPKEMSSYRAGSLSWHHSACRYAGSGVSETGALFSYEANWDAPGRWAVEVLTKEHRLYFRPMEKLAVQNRGSVKVEDVAIADHLDQEFKPGLFKQTMAFLFRENDPRLITVEEQLKHMDFYNQIEGIE